MRVIIFSTILNFLVPLAHSANIFIYIGAAPYSHRIPIWPLIEVLAQKGHNIIFFHPLPSGESKNFPPSPRITELKIPRANKFVELQETKKDFIGLGLSSNPFNDYGQLAKWPDLPLGLCDIFYKSSKVKEFLTSNRTKIDLVIYDSAFNECAFGIIGFFKCPHILFNAMSHMPWFQHVFGYSGDNHWVPDLWKVGQMNLVGRIFAEISSIFMYHVKLNAISRRTDEIFKKVTYLPKMPPIEKMEKNTSLIFLNSHPSEEYSRALPPFMISIGGIHCKEDNKSQSLPHNLQEFIRNDSIGFFFVSFGTFIKVKESHKYLVEELILAFREMGGVRFIWKWDGGKIENLPPYVFVSNWMPQQKLLAHPKILGFISHGGLLGVQEAIFHAVPLILMPTYVEPNFVASRMESRGLGIKLDFFTATKDDILSALRTLMHKNNTYKKSMRRASELFKSREKDAISSALWWTEYVLIHKNTEHLKPQTSHLTWYELRLLDVWTLLILLILISLFLLFKLLKIIHYLYLKSIKYLYIVKEKQL